MRGAVVTDSSWKSWTSGVAALAAARRADNSTSAPDAATKPADAAAADAIDAVRAVADVSVQAIRRRRTDAVVEMKISVRHFSAGTAAAALAAPGGKKLVYHGKCALCAVEERGLVSSVRSRARQRV